MCHAGFGGVDSATGEYYCFLETFGGGYGGRLTSDGPDAVQTHGQNTENAPVEETELNYPVQVTRLSLVEDSDGPGRFRGGLGLRKDYLFSRPTTFTVLADRDKAGPWGVLGGLDGKPAEYVLVRDGEERRLGAKTTLEVLARRRDQLPHLRRRRVRAADRARARAWSSATSARARSAPRAPARSTASRSTPPGGSTRSQPLAFGAGRDRPDHLRGDPQRARRGDGRDGPDPQAQRVLDQHQDALGLLVRVLRRRAPLLRPGLRPAGAPRLDGRAGPARRPRLRPREPRARRRDHHERPLPERRPPERRQPDLARSLRRQAPRVRREPRPPRRRRRRRPGEHRRLPGGLPGRRDHPARQDRRGRRGSSRTSSSCCSPRSAPSTRPPATSAPRSRRTPPACAGSRRSSSASVTRRSSTRWPSCSPTPSAGRSPSSPTSRTASTRPRGRSTTTATPTSRCI